jgi:hypothetical protein
MPEPVRARVQQWAAQYKKKTIRVETTTSFFADEDNRVEMINLFSGSTARAQVAGAFSGMTTLSPNARIPLEPGVVAIVTGFFLGVPFLELYQGSAPMIEA